MTSTAGHERVSENIRGVAWRKPSSVLLSPLLSFPPSFPIETRIARIHAVSLADQRETREIAKKLHQLCEPFYSHRYYSLSSARFSKLEAIFEREHRETRSSDQLDRRFLLELGCIIKSGIIE